MYMDVDKMRDLGIENCVVYLDGAEIEHCVVEADEEKGYVVVLDWGDYAPGMEHIPQRTLHGQVIIVIEEAGR